MAGGGSEARFERGVAALYDWGAGLALLGSRGRLYRSTVAAVSPADGQRILDVGCGTGLLTIEIARAMRRGEVVGVDASEPMLEVARSRRSAPLVRYEAGRAEALRFPDRSFDAVVSALLFHHVPVDVKRRAAREIARVLRPGGRAVVTDFAPPWNAFGRAYSFLAALLDAPEVAGNSAGLVASSLADAGLETVAAERVALGSLAVITAVKPA